jgi:epoxyqueuosine reductase QueG
VDRPEFAPLPDLRLPAVADLLAMDEAGFRAAFGATPIGRRGLARVRMVAERLG